MASLPSRHHVRGMHAPDVVDGKCVERRAQRSRSQDQVWMSQRWSSELTPEVLWLLNVTSCECLLDLFLTA